MCIFCDIVKGDIPCRKIYEDDNTLAFLDISAEVEGHTLVIPKRHYVNILDIPNEELSLVMASVKKIANHFVDNCGYTGVNILNASGEDAQQSVFHLHFHILPRYKDDGVNSWPELPKYPDTLEQMCEKLKIK